MFFIFVFNKPSLNHPRFAFFASVFCGLCGYCFCLKKNRKDRKIFFAKGAKVIARKMRALPG
jgi:hypothetical protein